MRGGAARRRPSCFQPPRSLERRPPMAEISGNEILARCLKAQGVKDLFFIMGGPMLDAESCCIKEGIRLIDTRHEQGASYMAQAYSRVTQGPGRSEEHTSELQSQSNLVCRLLLEKKKKI